MKVKEISQMANIAWSPAAQRPSYLACGTTAKQLDASFNTNSSLNLYDLNTGQTNLEMKLTASIESPARFHALQWSGLGSEASGLIYAGCENKAIYIYDAAKLLAKASDSLVGTTQGLHTGPVFTISCNYLKANFVACGSSDSEVTVWDVTNLSAPIIPGKKLSLGADVTCVEFNRQVEHIFASTCAGHCVVWDLRKQSSIMTISDTVSRMKTSNVIWNPHVATQLLLSSDNDLTPWAQMWDLRYATSPIKTLEGHQRGVLKTAWCVHDPNLLITTAKDSKIYVWNPNEANRGSEIVGEFPSYNQWSFDLDWCKHDPSLVAVSSVDGCVSVYSLLGGGLPPAQSDKFSQIADSFPGMDIPAVVPQGASPQPIRLRNPPKWFARSAGASFAFGGRLVSWNNQSRSVEIAQVVTEPELVERSSQLEAALSQPQFGPYCQSKAEAATQPSDQMLWQYIGANFAESPRTKIMELLGYSTTQVSSRLCPAAPETEGVTAEVLAEKMANLGTANDGSTGSLDPSEQFEMIASGQSFDKTPETETAELEGEGEASSVPVSLEVEVKEGNNQGLITQALLVGDLESAVDLCLKDGMYPHALTLAAHAGPHLFDKTRDAVLKQVDGSIASLVGAVVRGDLTTIATTTKLSNWKEALVAILTYCSNEQFSQLAETLGERLEAKGDSQALLSAVICYMCAGSLEKCVSCWIKTRPSTNKPQDMQDLVEIIMGLQRSLSCAGHSVNLSEGSTVSSLLCQYASLLAAQGVLRTAVSYLNSATQGEMAALRDRLYRALGYPTGTSTATPATPHQTNQRRTSTPHAYGQQQSVSMAYSSDYHWSVKRLWLHPKVEVPQFFLPSQFTPSVQDQQRSVFGAPPLQPLSAPMQNPTFYNPMNPSGPVPQQITPMEPQYGAPPPVATVPPQGPPPAGGLRRGRPGRYIPDSSVTSSTPSGMLNPPQPTPYFTPSAGVTPTPLGAPPLATPQFFSPMSPPTDSTMYGDPQQQQQQQQSQVQLAAKTPAALDSSVPRGWNDPPPPSASRKAKQQQQQQGEAAKPVEPIMCPVPGGMMPEPPQQFMGFQHPQYGAEALRSPPAGPMAAVGEATVPAAASEPPVKGPLPAEHQVIQDILNEVQNRCLLVVQNQQMKQRLEDIGVKMELLYDKLRMNQLSPASVSGVHRIVSHVQAGDYRGALTVHAETIAKGSFSELSSFMPPLKLLLQYCMQLQVFL